MKKAVHEILASVKQLLSDETFKNECKVQKKDFSRNRIISFPQLVGMICNLMRKSLQVELIDFSEILGSKVISKQAFSAARQKILPKSFAKLNKKLIDEYYENNFLPTFMGYRLIVIDGSTLQLPDSVAVRRRYGVCKNQKNLNKDMAMARISYAYDPCSSLTLDAIIQPYYISERSMVYGHILNITPVKEYPDLYLFDRGYPSIALLAFLLFLGKDFVMRCSPGNWIKEIKEFLNSGQKDGIIEINLKRISKAEREGLKKRLPEINLQSSIKFRVLIIELSTGEKEILVTSLINSDRYEYGIFKGLYNFRWRGEEGIKVSKVRTEIENFSGTSLKAVEQDFYATIFTENVIGLLVNEAQEEYEEAQQKKEQTTLKKRNTNTKSIEILQLVS